MDPSTDFGIDGGTCATQIQRSKNLKVAIIGPPKSGKSWFACTAPGIVSVNDYDDRKASLETHPNRNNLIVRTFRDTLTNPTVITNIETQISILKFRKASGKKIPDSFVHDTISNFIVNGLINSYLKENPNDGRRIKLGGTNPQQIGISYDRINVTTRFLEYLLTEYSALGNVIFVFHERDEKDRDRSTKEETKYTGLVTVEPQYAQNILTLFNEVFRIKVGGDGKYKVYCRPNYEVCASTTMLLDSEEPPNLMDMIAKHEARKAAQIAEAAKQSNG